MDFQAEINQEILQGSYWEHFKKAKELALVYPPDHEKRREVEVAMNEILAQQKKPPLRMTFFL